MQDWAEVDLAWQLVELVARGLRFDDGLLVVCDGAKALSAGVR